MIPPSFVESFTLPSLVNLASREITDRAPWALSSLSTNCNPTLGKKAVRVWQSNPQTSHLFYSAYEADNPTIRLSKENGPRLLRAIVVDYDCYSISDETLAGAVDDAPENVAPSIISRSHSGGVHAIWFLEESVWVVAGDFRKRLLDWFAKALKLSQLLPNLDDKVYHDAMIYHHAGRDWQQCDGRVISKATIGRAVMECGERASFRGHGVAVPLDVVSAEVDARYPGRWQGIFEEGARGCRFWDDSGDALSAIVKPEGMLCYTGDKGFMDWATLFGRGFVEKYLDDKVGGAANCSFFDGRDFWVYSECLASWQIIAREDLARKLKVEFGLSGTLGKGENATEIDRAVHHVTVANRVSSAAPFVFRKTGLLYLDGQRHLNVASGAVVQPATGDCAEDDFPWIANFLDNSFAPPDKSSHDQLLMAFAADPQEQLWRFLAWLKRIYTSGLNLTPCQGHVLILAGEPGCGKTLLADVLIGGVLGGKKDATSFLLGESKFSKHHYTVPLWTVNDAQAASDPQRKARYNALVKKVAANREFEMEAKFRDAVDVAWQGRLVITCNVDPESIQVMPQMDSSMEDKILALRISGAHQEDRVAVKKMEEAKWFGLWNGRTPDQNIDHELPAFLNWLLAWEVPQWIDRDPRFGYRAWCHGALKEHADSVNYGAGFEEILDTFLGEYFQIMPDKPEWRGTCTQLLIEFQDEVSVVRHVSREFNTVRLGRNLSSLVSRKEDKCLKTIKDGRAVYCFPREKWT